jgi:hypothetical protein
MPFTNWKSPLLYLEPLLAVLVVLAPLRSRGLLDTEEIVRQQRQYILR